MLSGGEKMGNSGYIKLQRSLKNWEHYDDPYALKLFVHLLLSAAFIGYFDGGVYVDRGQILIGIRSLAQELNFTYQRTRTLLSTLEATHTLTQSSTRRGTLITIVKWDVFQASVKKVNAASGADFSAASNAPAVKNQRTHYIKECINKNDHKERNNSCANFQQKEEGVRFDFELCWREYPNKKGRNKITKKALAELDKLGTEKVLEAVRRYKAECEADNRDMQYVQHGSTFFNGGYADYLADDWKPPAQRSGDGLPVYDDFVIPF